MLHQGRVLLGGLVHLRDGFAHLGHAARLFFAGGADLAHDVGDAADRGHHLLHRPASLVHELRTLLHAFHTGTDQALDFFCRISAALRQVAHLAGHDGEAAALLAGPRSLDGGVQGQDVGLEGNAVDHADDVGDAAAGVVDAAHRLHHLGHHLATLRCHVGGVERELVGLLGVVGVLAHGRAELLHRGGGLLQGAGLALGACRQVVVAMGDLAAGGGHALGVLAHVGHGVGQARLHVRQGLQQLARLVALLGNGNAHAQVTPGDVLCRLDALA